MADVIDEQLVSQICALLSFLAPKWKDVQAINSSCILGVELHDFGQAALKEAGKIQGVCTQAVLAKARAEHPGAICRSIHRRLSSYVHMYKSLEITPSFLADILKAMEAWANCLNQLEGDHMFSSLAFLDVSWSLVTCGTILVVGAGFGI